MSGARHPGGRGRKRHDEHANHEAWAIPYADLLTLLLAFFVVMYAISSVNAGKYRVLSDSLFAAFRGEPRTMQPIQVGDKQAGTGTDQRPTPEHLAVLQGKAPSSLAPVPVAQDVQKASAGRLPPQAAAAAAALSHVADEVERAMDSLVHKDMVTVRRSDFWIEVEMRTDILFPSGSARLSDSAVGVIEQLGSVLAPFPNPIRVEGHTDNKPIRTAVFSSNWELSAARAGSVVRVLSSHGVGPERLAVIGYGEQRPLKSNATDEGRNANRRVVVVILSTELMRQSAPGQISGPLADSPGPATTGVPAMTSDPATGSAPAASSGPAPATKIGTVTSSGPAPAIAATGEDGATHAIAAPYDAPQASPAPRPAESAARSPTPATGGQTNTGTDRAP